MDTRTKQRLLTIGLLAIAGLALAQAFTDEAPRSTGQPAIIEDQPLTPSAGGAAPTDTAPEAIDPIEAFLPRSGQASACREPVGVDLVSGYAATLTINGIAIAPEQMNVKLDEGGQISNELTASRSLAKYTFGPEEGCPNGSIIRATNNVLRACVYRVEDGPANCVIYETSFDVL